ncbi:Alpha-amylase/branching enzyme, C-terminal all beta [Dillenia turbinata]|uniref:Alpha-amylase/branching enzyme, C-terminal all beta n=1 Tax=Dillenia turbinata TaxID=194707 RepID=A0AAN8ZMA4_9MAGN
METVHIPESRLVPLNGQLGLPKMLLRTATSYSNFGDLREGTRLDVICPRKYRVALDSDAWEFAGPGRVGHDADRLTNPEGIPGLPVTSFNNRPNSVEVLSPARTCVVYYRVEEDVEESDHIEELDETEETTVTDVVSQQEVLEEAIVYKDDNSGPAKLRFLEDEDMGDDASDD